MSLNVEILGTGPSIVLLHGWAMNLEVWRDVANVLSQDYTVTLIDLPGFGFSNNDNTSISVNSITSDILPFIPDGSILVGWSMGGLIALNITLNFQSKVSSLVLVACNASFTMKDNWPHAMKLEVLKGFESSLAEDYQLTIQRFLTLQVRGAEHSKQTMKTLKNNILQSGVPNKTVLYDGLQILKNSDYSHSLHKLDVPVLLLFGRLDMLVPVAVAEIMVQQINKAELFIFSHAAHAPFLSHSREFIQVFGKFLKK